MILIAAVPMFSSCILDDSDVNYVDAHDLGMYAKRKLSERIALPVEALELALEFDEFLRLPAEEQLADTVFNGRFNEIEDCIYRIQFSSRVEFRNTYCQIRTGGMSVRAPGAVWVFDIFEMHGNDFDYSNLDYSFSLPAGSELVVMSPSDSTWVMTMGDDVTKMKQHPKQGSLYRWTVETQGSEETSIDIVSEYRTGLDFLVRERVMDSGQKTNTYSGHFYTDIFRDGEPLDYCYISFQPGTETVYHTSR